MQAYLDAVVRRGSKNRFEAFSRWLDVKMTNQDGSVLAAGTKADVNSLDKITENRNVARLEIAIVTGRPPASGSRHGSALRQRRAKVAIWDLNEEGAERAAAALGIGRGVASRVDRGQLRSDRSGTREGARKFGPVQILVNNAGITVFRSFMMTEIWDQVMTVNLKSVMFCTQAVTGHAGGEMVASSISSSSAQAGSARMTAYAASKGE
jgi:2-hydroxycyclohexanecarboxyl-CoA dehydrogenase